jgi:hypothetical protein
LIHLLDDASPRTTLSREGGTSRNSASRLTTQTVYFSRYVVTRKELKDLFNKYRAVVDDKK